MYFTFLTQCPTLLKNLAWTWGGNFYVDSGSWVTRSQENGWQNLSAERQINAAKYSCRSVLKKRRHFGLVSISSSIVSDFYSCWAQVWDRGDRCPFLFWTCHLPLRNIFPFPFSPAKWIGDLLEKQRCGSNKLHNECSERKKRRGLNKKKICKFKSGS